MLTTCMSMLIFRQQHKASVSKFDSNNPIFVFEQFFVNFVLHCTRLFLGTLHLRDEDDVVVYKYPIINIFWPKIH